MKRTFNIADLFELVADAMPEREALVCGEARATFSELEERANRLAHFLNDQGVEAGDHVGLYMYNCNEYLEGMLACFKIRAVPINVNYRYVDAELLYIFDDADMVACIHGREFIPAIESVSRSAPDLKLFISVDDGSDFELAGIGAREYEAAIREGRPGRDFEERSDDDLFILYTGGTTGMPKGVMWPHKSVFFAGMGGGGHFHPDGPCSEPEDIVSRATGGTGLSGIALAPLMHGACWWYACIQLLAGNKLVLNPNRSVKGEQVWDIVEQEKINTISIVGDAMAIPLLDALKENPGRWDLSSVLNVGSGGAVFSDSKQQEFKQIFPNVLITNVFGSSESGQMGMDSGQRKAEAGLGNVVRSQFMDVIVEEEGRSPRRAQLGEMGIFARSGHLPLGYYGDPEKTARTMIQVDGKTWLMTGDVARLEEDESITVFGRGSNCINSGGEKVFPEEVEQALKAHPDIVDCLVVGMPDERWGSKVTAVVSVRNDKKIVLDEVQQEIRGHIAGYKLPRELHVAAEIERSPSGKPDYQWAQAYAASRRGLVEE
ncbi:MAG: acyl-CoA synthetase [Deltaproteobacteria bacterium]|nr:acyl-CoA synthetase [Deltaproteobacteria bacterium]